MRSTRLVLLACAGAALATAASRELRLSLSGDPKSFDALHVSDENSEIVRYLTGGVLARINRTTDQVEPELAESWSTGDGGRSLTFKLRPGLKFSDGTPLTADDVARTLSIALDPKQASPQGDPFRGDKGDPSVHVDSPLSITIRYPEPKPDADRLFDALSIIPAKSDKLPASAGPFYIASYEPGQYVRLARNPNYWKRDKSGAHLPYLDAIQLDIQSNHDIETARFLRGETQLINKLDPESFDRIAKAQPAAARNLGPSLDSEFMWFNQAPSAAVPEWKRKWFTSAGFRHAVSEAIRRDDISRVVFRGYAHPAAGILSPANHFWALATLKPLPFDLTEARKRLAADGFTLRDGVLHDRENHPVEFSLITNAGNHTREAAGAVIQDDLRQLGIKVNLVTLDFGSLVERISRTLAYEACLLGFANMEISPNEQLNVWLSSGPQHAWWPREKTPATAWEARIDQLEMQQTSEPSRALRKKAFDEVQRIAVAEEPIIYLVNPDYLTAVSPALHGLAPSTAPPQMLWNIEWLRLE
jgi:peptide/nickel transport system substrate-binding protein